MPVSKLGEAGAVPSATILFARMTAQETRAMKKWPKTVGRIIRSDFTTTGPATSAPRVIYGFKWMETRLRATISAGHAVRTRHRLPKNMSELSAGNRRVQVFYNPDVPTQSTLSPSGAVVLTLVFWFIAVAFAVAAFAGSWLIS